MLYTSITTSLAFASLALTPIPPVQVFGLFVAFGVMLAWFVTITMIPAYICRVPERLVLKICEGRSSNEQSTDHMLGRFLSRTGKTTLRGAYPIIALSIAALAVGAWGITKIQVNDNPIRWFTKDHPIRVADTVLNKSFGGTYMAYLTLSPAIAAQNAETYKTSLKKRMEQAAGTGETSQRVFAQAASTVDELAGKSETGNALLDNMEVYISEQERSATDDESEIWATIYDLVDEERASATIFKGPEVLHWMEALQDYLLETNAAVGKTSAVTDIVKTVHRELREGKDSEYRIPNSSGGVAETLITFQNGHRAHDLWHFVTPDYQRATIWLQLRSGDNLDMASVINSVDTFVSANPPPLDLKHEWFGLTHINMVWQNKMVNGMRDALAGSFLVVFLCMTVLFRSVLWGFLSMIPLTVSIVLIYGIIGLIGKDYDMPVAVLSSLALGLAVDFAIHFMVRVRQRYAVGGSLMEAITYTFGEPAIAITRNALIISIGFLPLLAAPLVPYNTVGILIASILMFSAIATLLILPALLKVFEGLLVRNLAQEQDDAVLEQETSG
jgi:predicted RND superfamily exporter protein